MRIGAWAILAATLAFRTAAAPPIVPELTPRLVTTAGGTWVTVNDMPFAMKVPRVEIGLRDQRSREVIALFPAEGVQKMDDATLRFQTPRFIEACADVRISDGGREVILPRALCFRTLAFTANQGQNGAGSQSVSIVDTYDNRPFATKESMGMGLAVIPMNMAYNTATTARTSPGRVLYMVDYASGNLEVFDTANFSPMDLDGGTPGVQSSVILQDPAAATATPRAFDLALSRDGRTMFVTHVTSGMSAAGPVNPGPGGVSVLTLDDDGKPRLYDVDQNPDPETTSAGAPAGSGITRLRLKTGEGEYAYVYPLSIQSVSITDGINPYVYRDGEPFPGEYLFISAVSEAQCIQNCACAAGRPCPPPMYAARPAIVAIIDNNRTLYCDPAQHHPGYCNNPWLYAPGGEYSNPRDWMIRPDHNAYKATGAGVDGLNLGQVSNALGFSLTSGTPPPNATALGPTVYMLNENEGKAYLFNYTQATGDWSVVMNGSQPFTIPTGLHPTDVKVQGNVETEPLVFKTLAYITNAGDDTIYYINTEDNSLTNAYLEDICTEVLIPDGVHNPTSIDTKGDGITGYVADFESRTENGKSTVSVFNLANPSLFPNHCNIEVGTAPIRIVVQPWVNDAQTFQDVRNSLAFAQSSDFTTPSKQSNLMRDWESVHQLEQTSASPQAVVSNINAFQGNVDKWVTNAELKKSVNEGVNLYRAAYIHDHPLPRQ